MQSRLNGLWLHLRVLKKCRLLKLLNEILLMTNVRGIHKTPMAESVLAHILALTDDHFHSSMNVKKRKNGTAKLVRLNLKDLQHSFWVQVQSVLKLADYYKRLVFGQLAVIGLDVKANRWMKSYRFDELIE